PGLRPRFESDLRAFALLASALQARADLARVLNLGGFIELFAELVLQELDFRLEAMNMVDVGVACESAGMTHVRIPRPIPGMVTERVLVMEQVPGVRYTDASSQLDDT